MHSATKYLNGHSDVIAGALAAARDDALWQSIRYIRVAAAASSGLRVVAAAARDTHAAPAGRLRLLQRDGNRAALRAPPEALHVLYPGLASNPGHAVAARQMSGGFGG